MAVSKGSTGRQSFSPDAGGKLNGRMSLQIAMYRRVDASPAEVTSLDAQADAAENITIRYAVRDGRQTTLRLDPSRRRIIRE